MSPSVSPLPEVKLVSHSPWAGSDLHLGTEVESFHSHVLPQHLSCKCHQTSPVLLASPAVPPQDWEGALGPKSHIPLLACRHWQLSLGLLPEAQQESRPQKLGEVLPPPGTGVGMYVACCRVSRPSRVVWLQPNPPSPCPPPAHLPANISACTPRFTTKGNKKICASPNDPNNQKLMQNLDKKVQSNKQGKPPRPRGRPRRQKRQRV